MSTLFKNLFFAAAFLLFFPFQLQAQEGYRIDIKVKGLQDTTAYLGYYYGESTYIKDTAAVNGQGELRFADNAALLEGIYFLVVDKTRLFDFAVEKDQQRFAIKTDTLDYIGRMEIKGSDGAKLFLDNMKFNVDNNKAALPHITVLNDSTASEADKKKAQESFSAIDEKVKKYQDKVVGNHSETLLCKIFKANKEIDIPKGKEREKEDPRYSLNYYKAHYWDYFNLKDPSLLRLSTPIYKEKLDIYLDKLFVQHPDTIAKAIDRLVEVAKQNDETYKYFVWNTTLKYQNPSTMGLDAVFVHMYDTYFASGEMDYWANATMIKNIKERADTIRKSLIGIKAPNLIMQDLEKKSRSMYDLNNKYVILYFFDPDCGYCRKETPKLKSFYKTTSFDVEVFAVSADTSMVKMKDYIKEYNLDWITVNGPRTYTVNYHELYDAMSTPTLYVLDEKKKIIAKKLEAEQLQDFLTRYEKAQAQIKSP